MKKLAISALCGLCLFGAFVCASQPVAGDETTTELALSRRRAGVRV